MLKNETKPDLKSGSFTRKKKGMKDIDFFKLNETETETKLGEMDEIEEEA